MNCSEIAVSTISSVNFLTDVIVPLLSALIGGLMALFGVYITLKRDKNEHEQEQEEKACPFFTILDDGDKRITSDDVCVWGFFSPNMESNSAFRKRMSLLSISFPSITMTFYQQERNLLQKGFPSCCLCMIFPTLIYRPSNFISLILAVSIGSIS